MTLRERLIIQRKPWAVATVMTERGPAPAVTRVGSRRKVVLRTPDDVLQLVGWLNELEAEVLCELPPLVASRGAVRGETEAPGGARGSRAGPRAHPGTAEESGRPDW